MKFDIFYLCVCLSVGFICVCVFLWVSLCVAFLMSCVWYVDSLCVCVCVWFCTSVWCVCEWAGDYFVFLFVRFSMCNEWGGDYMCVCVCVSVLVNCRHVTEFHPFQPDIPAKLCGSFSSLPKSNSVSLLFLSKRIFSVKSTSRDSFSRTSLLCQRTKQNLFTHKLSYRILTSHKFKWPSEQYLKGL